MQAKAKLENAAINSYCVFYTICLFFIAVVPTFNLDKSWLLMIEAS